MIDIDALASRAVVLTSKEDKSNKNHKRLVAIQGALPSGSLPGALEDTAGGVPEHKQGQDFVEVGMKVRDTPKLVNDE